MWRLPYNSVLFTIWGLKLALCCSLKFTYLLRMCSFPRIVRKVMEFYFFWSWKVMKSHGIWTSKKSMNPVKLLEVCLTPDLPTLTRSHLWDWPYKPVRKPARNLRRLFRGTITQISIMKTLTKHQIAGNKSFIFVMVCHTVLQSNEHQTEACTFGVHKFPL